MLKQIGLSYPPQEFPLEIVVNYFLIIESQKWASYADDLDAVYSTDEKRRMLKILVIRCQNVYQRVNNVVYSTRQQLIYFVKFGNKIPCMNLTLLLKNSFKVLMTRLNI